MEWAPIRDELIVLSPDVNNVEYGHEFTLAASRVLQDGRYYIHDMDAINNDETALMISIYEAEKVNEVGPVRRLVIPVETTLATGGVTSSSGRTGAAILLTPQFSDYLLFDGTVLESSLSMSFDMGQYTQELTNKRILGVNVLLGGQRSGANDAVITVLNRSQDFFGILSTDVIFYNLGDAFNATGEPIAISRIPLGAFCRHWQFPVTAEFVPWKFLDLARFDASSASRLYIQVGCGTNVGGVPGGFVFLYYCALEVFYVEENRVAYGGLGHAPVTGQDSFRYGANIVTMRDPATRAMNPVLTAGRYAVTVWSGEAGSSGPVSPVLPQLNATRELYAIPPHPGVLVSIPSPLDLTAVGKTVTATQTHVLPQLSLHASGGPLTEVHVYGRQAVAQVWGSLHAQQEIFDSPAGGEQSWPHVRYYARRWGDSTIPLLLDSPDIGGSSVQVTPDEFDALEEINGGWKEITLRFAMPPSMGTGTNPRWRWTAAGETAGNRWEVLGATAPAVSGVAGNLFNLVPSPNQLSTATYGAPTVGSTINAQWIPQYAPPVTAVSDDATTDMVLIFGMDMPTVTGFAVTGMNQVLTGIGQECGVDPCCVPSGLSYHQLTWSATSANIPASGFGYYELQRMDTISDWATIMQNVSPTGASFSDFEARVGVLTSYRIRAVDEYGFDGPWSSTVTITMASPGASGGDCIANGHVLLFTSNERQDGSINLAYASVWEDRIEEGFNFAEAGFVQLQAMYGTDFFTAFRPTERGGEQFSRTVLVQAAAIAPETLGDFTSLRDMAWDSVSYICVRDEDGNRWFATVLVPNGRVLRDRRLYLANVTIIEVTDTPSPVGVA